MTSEILKNIGEIYACLADGKSRKLFWDKLQYASTLDKKYVYNLLKDAFLDFSENLCSLENIDKEIIIYGAGINCETVIFGCKEHGIQVSYICDKAKEKQGKKYFDIEVISPEELLKYHKDAYILVSTTSYYEEVMAFLGDHYEEKHIISFATARQLEIIRKQYFDEVVKFEDGEVFIDGGCFGFETSNQLLDKCKVKKIYAFEPDQNNMEKVKYAIKKRGLSNVECITAGLWDCNTVLHFNSNGSIMSCVDEYGADEIKVVTIDGIVKEKVTFIKMDIEGSELKALHGAEKTIMRDKPKLAISIYHKLEDILDIPAYIHHLVPEYKFYIRHYSLNAAETILYAIYD